MIQPSTVVLTIDNSGARRVRCIKVYKKPGKGQGKVGDILKIIVLRLRNRGFIRVNKGEIHLGLITRVSVPVFRLKKGYFFKFDFNTIIVLSKKNTPIGTRLFGPCAKELRNKFGTKIPTLTTCLI